MIPFVEEIIQSPTVPDRAERYQVTAVHTPRRVTLPAASGLTPKFNLPRPFVLVAQVTFASSVITMDRDLKLHTPLLREDCAHRGCRVRNKISSVHLYLTHLSARPPPICLYKVTTCYSPQGCNQVIADELVYLRVRTSMKDATNSPSRFAGPAAFDCPEPCKATVTVVPCSPSLEHFTSSTASLR